MIAGGEDEHKAEVEGEADAKDAAAETPAGDWGAPPADDPWGTPAAAAEGGAEEQTQTDRRPQEEEEDKTLTYNEALEQQKAKQEELLSKLDQLNLRVANDGDDPFAGAQKVEKAEESFFEGNEVSIWKTPRTRTC